VPTTPTGSDAYVTLLRRLLTTEPLQLVVARSVGEDVVGITVVRVYENTFNVTKVHLEGMVTSDLFRSRGVGRAMLDHVKSLAAKAGGTDLVGGVNTQNAQAIRFFLREKLAIQCMWFNGNSDFKSSVVTAAPESAPFYSTVINDAGHPSALELAILRAAETVHRQLRMKMPVGTDAYLTRMGRIAQDGARIVVVAEKPAADAAADVVPVALGVGVFRFYVDAATQQLTCWVDDLVTDSNKRSLGVGAWLADAIRAEARARNIPTWQLDSGVWRHQAHKFYFREGLIIDRFSICGPVTQ